MKIYLLTLITMFISLINYGQLSEPDSYDYKESYSKTIEIKKFYDQNVLSEIPNDAMFWIDIQPNSNFSKQVNFVKNNELIYERTTFLSKIINGEEFNHGLHDMIKTDNQISYSTMFEKDTYQNSENAINHNFNIKVRPLFSDNFNLEELESEIIEENHSSYLENGEVWYRLLEEEIDISFNLENNAIQIYYYLAEEYETTYYSEVYEGITRAVKIFTTKNFVNAEGYCLKEKIETNYNDYQFTFDDEFLRENKINGRNKVKKIATIEVRFNEVIITPKSDKNKNYGIIISDIMGRIVYQGNSSLNQEK